MAEEEMLAVDAHRIAHRKSTCSEFTPPSVGSIPKGTATFIHCAECE